MTRRDTQAGKASPKRGPTDGSRTLPEDDAVSNFEGFFVSGDERIQLATSHVGDVFDGRASGARDAVELLAFWIGEEEYAVDIVEIQEIIKVPAVTQVPRCPAAVIGIISLRGTIVPVLDLRMVLRLGRAPESSACRILVMRADGDPIGLLVDRVTSVVRLRQDWVEAVPRTMQHGATEFLRGVGRIEDRLLILLDLNAVVAMME